jgi:hypothetical protein
MLKMADEIFVPFPRKLYDDLVRFSDGKCDPVYWAVDRLEDWIERNFSSECSGMGWASDGFMAMFEERIEEFAAEFYPDAISYWEEQGDRQIAEKLAARRPLVWKGIEIAGGSDVRMGYGGREHYGKVVDGKITDDDGAFTPSEWASKVAGGTSRNAWRDLWFRAPGSTTWLPASLLREVKLDEGL